MYKFKDIIEEINEFNTDLKYGLDDIVGVTIEKGLIPTIANLTQTALDKFYIIKPETFVYNPRTHGVRLGMGYNGTCNTYITSWNNVAFKVRNEAYDIVTPKYLWLYFCRPIWDRLTNFLAWGSSTIVFAWKDFLDIDINLPSIEKQREIVSEYETLTTRIRLNEQMIARLEETAQALYRHTFVDNIDKQNLPQGWHLATLTDIATFLNGIACQKYDGGHLPVLKIRELSQGMIDEKSDMAGDNVPKEYIIHNGDLIFSWSATLFVDVWTGGDCVLNQHLFKVTPKGHPQWFVQMQVERHIEDWNRLISAKATSMGHIKREDLETAIVIIPCTDIMRKMDEQMSPIFHVKYLKQQENTKLTELQSLLLAKMGNMG